MDHEFPKISDYGVIGDGRTAALVSSKGAIEWLCLPHFDSESFFAAVLDRRRGGVFEIKPAGNFESKQSYLRDTNVLVTEFHTETGRARLIDFFAVTNEENKREKLWPDQEIVRVVECAEGELRFEVELDPQVSFGKRKTSVKKMGRFGIAFRSGQNLLLLRTNLPLEGFEIDSGGAGKVTAAFVLKAGERAEFSLSHSDTAPAVIPLMGEALQERMKLTIDYWREWISRCRYEGPFADEVKRSALVLKLMMFAPSGAIVAALTTSLPEELGGSRNWDYRYCWLRDAAFTVRALCRLGYVDEADAFVSWMLHSTRLTQPKLQVLYSVFGHTRMRERELPALSGYRGSRPVRTGNGASGQFQLDVYGEVIDAVFAFLPHLKDVDKETREFLVGLGNVVCDLWKEPDDGIWEVRSGRKQHTHSKILAWVALDRLLAICRNCGWNAPYERFEACRNEIRSAVEESGYSHELGSYTRTMNGRDLDASLLVLPFVGYCDARAPRMKSTIEAIKSALGKDELVFRYRDTDDGMNGKEGAFGICGFWLAEALAKAGEKEEAMARFEALMRRRNDVGLWSEEIDATTGEFLGNYPQAFTHIGLINCALSLYQGQEHEPA